MRTRILWILVGLLTASAATAEPTPAGIEFFESKIRPVLVEKCLSCHSDEAKKQRGGLLLDTRAGLLKGGDNGPAIVVGSPEKSLLIKAIHYTGELKMPKKEKLEAHVIADFEKWIRDGLADPRKDAVVKKPGSLDIEALKKHWAFQPVRRPSLPQVNDASWGRGGIDAFVLAGLEKAGIKPAKAAEPRVWLRRVTFDLTGLPPTPTEMTEFEQAFARDPVAERARVVERLLASPAYGERWARHWLDLVRFSETAGHEFDFEIPEAYQYRDALIRALNADVPYDQLVREHIAGDLLERPRRHPETQTNESILATGFWFFGESKHSPVDIRGDGADRRDNMIDVFGKAFLGLTIACARCHDHKFDPIPTADYYSLVGYLQSSRFEKTFLDPPERFAEPSREILALREKANQRALEVSARVLKARLAKLPEALLALREGKSSPESSRAWTQSEPNRPENPFAHWAKLLATKDDKAFAVMAEQLRVASEQKIARPDDIVFATLDSANTNTWYRSGFAFRDRPAGSGDLTLASEKSVPVQRIHGPTGADSSLISGRLQGAIRSPSFVIERNHILYHVAGKGARINLIIDGFQQIRDPIYGGLTFAIDHGDAPRWQQQNVTMWKGLRAYIEVLDDGDGYAMLDRVIFSDQPAPGPSVSPLLGGLLRENPTPAALAASLTARLGEIITQWESGKLDAQPDSADRVGILNGLLHNPFLASLIPASEPDRELGAMTQKIREREATIPTPRRGLGLCDGSGVDEAIYIRGNHKTPGEPVARRFLIALTEREQVPHASGSGRLELANRLLSPTNPLPARVMVNRLWQHHFGRGIVGSVDNFGIQGQTPTHPELLDWLADEFVRRGWSMKAMHRMMLLSSTYSMSSRAEPEADAADAGNRLWHKMPVRRLEAESIRDAMLSVSGRLDSRMYGKGPHPFLTEHMQGRGRPMTGPLDGLGRRSVYLNVRRNFLNPMFLAFDFPTPFSCMGQRTVSNVPAQALTLLNNPFVIAEAKRWADKTLALPGTPQERIQRMYQVAFGRNPNADELREALDFLTERAKELGKVDDVRAWADLAHVLFNVKEFVFLE